MSIFDRRAVLLGGMAGISGAGLAACSPSAKAPPSLKDIKLGISTTKEGYQNFFGPAGQEKSPYAVEYAILPFDLSLQSINNGALDAGANFTDIPLTIWGNKMPDTRIIAVVRSPAANRYLGLVVRPGLKAKTIADLRGKRIGYLRSSNYHYYLLKILAEQGLSFADIEPVSLNRDTLPAAFASGQLDGWITQGIETVIATRRYGGTLISVASGDYAGNGVVVASLKAINDPVRSQAIGDYLLRFRKVIDWIGANDDAWADTLAKETGIEKAYFLEQRRHDAEPAKLVAVDDKAIADQQKAADVFARAGVIDGTFTAKGLWDKRFSHLLA